MKEQILDEFKGSKEQLDAFRERMMNLLQDLLRNENISLHQINCRTKDLESLSKKIDKKQGKYKSLSEITDIVGIRIITYLESDVDIVAKLIEHEFTLDKPNSIDKRILNTDQFGYKSLHIVVSLNAERSNLREYKIYAGLKCEIQIRSILQHAWAEIEHDLGYKGKAAIPETYIRNFNRLAALLETADIEFDRLKKELMEYEKEIPAQIKNNPQEVLINQASLNSFLETNEVFEKAKEIIGSVTGAEFYNVNYFEGMLGRFKLFDIKTIKELEDSIATNKENFLSFVNAFVQDVKEDKLPSSLPLYYYQHYLAAKSGSPEFVEHYFNSESPAISNRDNAAQRFVELFKKSQVK